MTAEEYREKMNEQEDFERMKKALVPGARVFVDGKFWGVGK